jgi:hypothetical protein
MQFKIKFIITIEFNFLLKITKYYTFMLGMNEKSFVDKTTNKVWEIWMTAKWEKKIHTVYKRLYNINVKFNFQILM